MKFIFQQSVKERFPDLRVGLGFISGLKTEQKNLFNQKRESIYNILKEKHSLDTLKDLDIIRAYRDFFWALGIDPTKIRPAAEALIRRILKGKSIPRINCVVDAYNLASMESGIALAAFDADLLKGDLIMRFAEENEIFLGIGMKEAKKLKGNELIINDQKQIIAIYPYRDADSTKVTKYTKEILLLICGAPRLEKELLNFAGDLAIDYITQLCGGTGNYQIFE
ncbi:MAG: B3/4 domain-containing protein [Candidatus Hodarchaeota archaeon]